MKTVVGIDYSYTSPAMCVHTGDVWSIDNCVFYVLNNKKLLEKINTQYFNFKSFKPYTHRIERFTNIAVYFVDILRDLGVDDIGIEGYSMNSKNGSVCDISECGGILRHLLYVNGIKFSDYSPATIKKYATGKGNSKKEAIYETFSSETNKNWIDILQPKGKKIGNPLSDIIDSYYISKKHFEEI